jgi:SPP1 gp7 family putative phage head morphogenesis protein
MSAVADAVPTHRRDPTGTATIRDRYARRLRGGFADINTLIREGVRERDVFGLQVDTLQKDLPPLARFDRDARKRDLFDEWLQERVDEDVLTIIERDGNRFIDAAYRRGLEDADHFVQAIDIDTETGDVAASLDVPVHERAVEDLYARNYRALEDITETTGRQVGEELAEGLAAGENPTTVARRLTDRVDSIGKTRATVLARTEIINAHSEAALTRYEQLGVGGVTVQAEWLTAGDRRVCPICQNLEGNTWTIEEVRQETMTLTEDDVADAVPDGRSASSFTGKFPVKPPAHPQCRCTLFPDVIS